MSLTCPRQYFASLLQTGYRMTVIPGGIEGGEISYNFPHPFLMLGFGQGNGTVVETIPFAPVAKQAQYATNLDIFFKSFGEANILGLGGAPVNGVTWVANSIGNFEKYLTQYLDTTQGGIGFGYFNEINVNAYSTPPGLVEQFWVNMDALATPLEQFYVWTELLELCVKLHTLSDLRLWNPPGKYLLDVAAMPNGPTILADGAVGNEEGISFLVLELKSAE
jgi:hypothetical protein